MSYRRRIIDEALDDLLPELAVIALEGAKAVGKTATAAQRARTILDLADPATRQIWSTDPLERVNKEIKRRTDVVGVFPNPEALLSLAGAVLVERPDEWAAADRRYFSERSMTLVTTSSDDNEGRVTTPELVSA